MNSILDEIEELGGMNESQDYARNGLFGLSGMTDDVWDKFEWPLEDLLNSFDDFSQLDRECSSLSSLQRSEGDYNLIKNHDCMWAGHCGSKEHLVDDFKTFRSTVPAIVNYQTALTTYGSTLMNKNSPYSNPSGRSLLLKTQFKQQQTQQLLQLQQQQNLETIMTFDSPPTSDDEEAKAKTVTLQLLQDAISECDSDLYDYFEDSDLLDQVMEEQAKETPAPVPVQFTSDHCYHKDKNATMRMNNLGIETPSDSEEEIDVVSVGDHKQTAASSRMACVLPNNPSVRDKKHIQRTMASAMTKGGMKTMVPRKTATRSAQAQANTQIQQRQYHQQQQQQQQQQQPAKRRAAEPAARGAVKRPKHRAEPASPYKRRAPYNHSSDSEPEPSEKRNLHNNMERQRRIDLRHAFDELRVLVPSVCTRERAPKVIILRDATDYCDRLGDITDAKAREIEELRRRQKFLRSRVSQLRLSLASKHR